MAASRGLLERREGVSFSMRDPFTVLGVAEDADDAEIRRRYLALVRDFPPDRDPDRFSL
jgi:curved DNA-binding protein CbpA